MKLQKPNMGIYNVYGTNIQIKGMESDKIDSLLEKLKRLPATLFDYADQIFIYKPNEELQKDFSSTYTQGIIVINLNTVNSEQELLKLVVHELFHSIEAEIRNESNELFGVYKEVEKEYLAKKRKLLINLRDDPSVLEKPRSKYWKLIDFNSEFDYYLYNIITYPILQFKLGNYFPSPYSVTSISEYMCVGLEVYLFEDKNWLAAHCPALYNLIQQTLQDIT